MSREAATRVRREGSFSRGIVSRSLFSERYRWPASCSSGERDDITALQLIKPMARGSAWAIGCGVRPPDGSLAVEGEIVSRTAPRWLFRDGIRHGAGRNRAAVASALQ